MAADHSARGSMKTGVKPETVCELQDTNDHRQVERKWRLPISVGKLSALEGRLINLHNFMQPWMFAMHIVVSHTWCLTRALKWRRLKCRWNTAHSCYIYVKRWRPCPDSMRQISHLLYIAFAIRKFLIFDLGGAGLRTELKHIIKCRKRNQMGFPQ